MQGSRKWFIPMVVFAAVVILVALLSWPAAALLTLVATPLALRRFGQSPQPVQVSGVQAETARLLDKLPRTFTVFHRVSVADAQVDHVVVGPSGVWAIMTMPHKGEVEEYEEGVRVAGRWMPYDPRQGIRSSATDLSELLRSLTGTPHWVEPLICLPQARVRTKSRPDDACVVGLRHLLPRLTNRTNRLNPRQCAGVISVLRDLANAGVDARLGERSAETFAPAVQSRAGSDNGASGPGLAAAPSPGRLDLAAPAGRSARASGSPALADTLHGYMPSRAAAVR